MGFHLVRVPLGLLLLAAAFLKYSDSSWEPFGQVFTVPPLIQLVFIELEGAIGVWLLLGFAPTLLRPVAIGYFVALAAASIALLLFGVPSCGCFGSARVSPWLTLACDMAAIAALAVTRPIPGRFGRRARWWSPFRDRHGSKSRPARCSACRRHAQLFG
jgi:hypothetical protein